MRPFLFVLALLLATKGFSQNEKFTDKLYFGGNLGASFGGITFVEISPLAGYRITPRFSAGLGATYIYYSYNVSSPHFSMEIYGGRVFSRFLITESLFAHVEYELLSVPDFVNSDLKTRVLVPGLYVGGGYRQPIGPRAFASIMILYNLNQTIYSINSNPIISIGFTIGR